ncbi:MAG: DUF3313 domain-containing protein [Deltaproteobacteria bacterium]|nr:DUF3313 domain-containing protein [Deltaproteobacteria bacterium]
MKQYRVSIALIVTVMMALMIAGCEASKQARGVDEKVTLVDPALLQEGKSGQALLRYVNPNIDVRRYTKVMLDPVVISTPEGASEADVADLQKLVSNGHIVMRQELSKDYQIVDRPGPGTMRIQAGLLNAQKSKPVRLITSVTPIGAGVSLVKNFTTGKPTGVGEITGEIKITDAATGEIIGEAVDKRVGGKNPNEVFNTWADANHAIEFWAKKLRFFLCTERRGGNCTPPGNY